MPPSRYSRPAHRAQYQGVAMTTFHQFSARSLGGADVPMSTFAGKVVLVVNTASECGFTPQYAGLEALYRRHVALGLVVLGFPCNQFGAQEPGDSAQIGAFCERNYGVTFPLFEKVEVNGPGAHPLFRWLSECLPGFAGRRVKWNSTKFLIGRDGRPLARFAPLTKPEKLEAHIQRALAR